MNTETIQCDICGAPATHEPVGAEYDNYCCLCFHDKDECPHGEYI